MIYGYDEAIQLPVKDLYDSQIMMASINAAKQMYEKGEQAIKDFNDKYKDFYTPIQKDQEWYNNNVVNSVQNEINRMYEEGIDPTRSSEGRSRIQKLINNLPYGTINQIKMSKDAANKYLENKALLERSGLYNEDFESAITKGMNLNNWSTVKNGMWGRLSPTEYKDLNKATSHWFDGYKDEYMYTKDGYDYFGISRNRINNAITKNMSGFINSDYGRYYYNNAANELRQLGIENPTQEQIINKLRSNIITANDEVTRENRQMNEKYKMQLELNDSLRKIAAQGAQSRATERYKKQLEGPDTGDQIPLSYTQKVQRSAMNRTTQKVFGDINNVFSSSKAIANYYDHKAKNSKNGKDNNYKNKSSIWKNINTELGKAKTENDVTNILRKHNLIDKNGNLKDWYIKLVGVAQKPLSDKQIDSYYDQFRGDVRGISSGITTKLLADSNSKEKYPEGNGKYYTVTFGRGVNTSKVRRAEASGRRLTKNSLSNLFNSWAKKTRLRGYLVSEQSTPYYIPNGNGQIDISGMSSVPLDKFKQFVEQHPLVGIKNQDGTTTKDFETRVKNAANSLGFIIKDYRGKEYKVDDKLQSDKKYAIWIPSTRTIEDNGTNFSDIDTWEDKLITTGSTTAGRQIIRQASNLGNNQR